MNTKRFALLLSVLLVFGLFLTACDSSASPSPEVPSTDAPPPSEGGSSGLDWTGDDTAPPKEIPNPPAGAIDFSDGNIGFLALNLSPGDADPSELSVTTHEGRSALLVNVMEDGTPYLGIDVSSLYGDKVADIRSIEMRLWLQRAGGTFYAASGDLEAYTGTDNMKSDFRWAVTMEKNNPTTIKADLSDKAVFAPGAKNILILNKSTGGDAGVKVGAPAANFVIDYIACYDASGSIIPADTSAEFDAPKGFGSSDMSFLFEITDEVKLGFNDDGKEGTSSGWGQAGALDKGSLLDIDLLQPGSVISVGYSADKAPELVFQSWDPGDGVTSWAKIAPFMVNGSGNIAQYRYEDCVEAFGSDDFEEYLDRIYIGDRDTDLAVKSFSIGQRVADIGYKSVLAGDDGFIDLTPFNVHSGNGYSAGGWSQLFRMDTDKSTENPPDFKPEWLAEGAYITAFYESEKVTQFIFQRFKDFGGEVWGGMNGTKWTGGYATPEVEVDGVRVSRVGVDQISYEGILEMWEDKGADPAAFYDELCAFWLQDDGAEYTLFKVVLYTPNP